MRLQPPKVLVIDEIGYLPLDAVQANLLFQVICRRYQRSQPLILTFNKALGEWARCLATIRSSLRRRWTGYCTATPSGPA